jgi:hypothetical protein
VPTKDRLTREEFQSRPTKNETSFLKAAAANAATTVVAPKHRRCASMRLSKQVAAKGLFHEYALECREGQRYRCHRGRRFDAFIAADLAIVQ